MLSVSAASPDQSHMRSEDLTYQPAKFMEANQTKSATQRAYGQNSMMHPFATHHLESSHPEDAEIERDRLPVQILAIEFNLDGNGKFVATIDLRPSGKSRDKLVNATVRPQGNQISLVEERRARPHEALVSRKYAEELRQLIEARPAEESANRR